MIRSGRRFVVLSQKYSCQSQLKPWSSLFSTRFFTLPESFSIRPYRIDQKKYACTTSGRNSSTIFTIRNSIWSWAAG